MQLLDSQKVALSVGAKDAAGNPVDLPAGSVAWSSSDDAVAAVVDNGDGSVELVTTGALGSVVVTADYTATDGTEFKGSLAVDVVAGAVAEIDVAAGTPESR